MKLACNAALLLFLAAFAVSKSQIEANDNAHPHMLTTGRAALRNEAELSSEYWRQTAQTLLATKLQQQQQEYEQSESRSPAKNIIMFLGDGMSVNTLTATRAYLGDSAKQLSFEQFPYLGLSRTYCVDQRTPDSASTATAYLSGVKANYGTIGVNAQVQRSACNSAKNVATHTESLAKWAQDAGKWAGLVTTARVTHASPAGVYAHTANRDWEYDGAIVGKCGNDSGNVDIARQLVEWPVGQNLHVVLGGGRRNFRNRRQLDEEGVPGFRSDQRDLIAEWLQIRSERKQRAEYVWNRHGLRSLNLKKTDYILGLFSSSHCPYHGDLKRQRLEGLVPSLSEMTASAIRLLSKHKQGYFLFVEGARIDMAHHENRAHLSLEDTAEFAKAVQVAWNMTSGKETLIVVTSDHAHTMSVNGYPSRSQSIFDLAPSLADDGLPYSILSYANGPSYADTYSSTNGRLNLTTTDTNDPNYRFMATVPLSSETHGGEDVAIFATGPFASHFTGTMEQSNIPALMAHAVNIGPFTKQLVGL